MTRPLKLTLWLLIGLLALLAMAITALVNMDLGRFSGTAERQLSALLEREVAFYGGLSVRVGRNIEIALNQARLGGGGAGLPDLLQIGDARVELATLPLLAGRLEVNHARLSDIHIALVEREDGSNNFTFPDSGESTTSTESGEALPVRLTDAELRSLSLRYDTPKRESPLALELEQAMISKDEDSGAAFALRGQLQGELLQLDCHIKKGRLASGQPDFEVALTGQLGKIHAEGLANLDDLLAPRRPRGEFRLTGPDARYLTDLLHIGAFTEGPLDVNLQLVEQEQRLAADVSGRFGEFDLQSTALLDLPLQLANAQLGLSASGPDIARLAAFTGLPQSFDGPFEVKGELSPGADSMEFTAAVTTDTIAAELQGEFPPGAALSKTESQIVVMGESLKATGGRLGVADLPDSTYRLATRLNTEGNRYRFDEMAIALGQHNIGGGVTLVVDRDYQLEDLSLTLDDLHRINGDASIANDLGSGRFELNASSPDLFQIAGRPAQLPQDFPGQLALDTQGEWQGGQWQLRQFDARFAGSRFSATGNFDDPPDFQQTELRVNVEIDSLAALNSLAARDLPPLPARLRFQLLGNPANVRVEQLTGELGSDEFSGSAHWVDGEVPRIVADLNADRLDLSPFFPTPEQTARQEPAPASTPDDEDGVARAIPDYPLPLDGMQARDLSFSVSIGEFILAPREVNNLTLRVRSGNGALFVPEFSMQAPAGSFSGELSLLPDPAGIRLLSEFSGKGMTLGLPAETPEDVAALPRFDMSSVLISRGATTRELAASLDGYLAITSGEGRIRAAATRYFASDFLTAMVNTVNPFSEVDQYTDIRCTAIALTAHDGVLAGEPLAIVQTNRFSAELHGSVVLESEALDINIRTIAEKGLGVGLTDLVNPFTRVGGTLASPRVELDPERAVKEGTFYIATLGLSLAAKRYKDRKLAGQDRCKLMLDQANPDFEELAEKYRQSTQGDQIDLGS